MEKRTGSRVKVFGALWLEDKEFLGVLHFII